MKLVVDANILFATLIKEGSTAEVLLSDKIELFAPEFLFEEFSKYEEFILKKTHRSKEEFSLFLDLLRDQITIISQGIITPFLNEAEKISPDPKDNVYLALALALKSNIWSNGRKLKEKQNKVKIYSTEDLINKVNILKKNKK